MKKSLTADWPLLVQHVVATTRGIQMTNIYTSQGGDRSGLGLWKRTKVPAEAD